MDYLIISIASLIFLALIYASVVSIFEHEFRAARISALLASVLSAPFFIVYFVSFPYQNIVSLLLIGVFTMSLLVLFIPTGSGRKGRGDAIPAQRIDERDIMFSRMRYKPGTERFEKYYRDHPDLQELDDHWRVKPGLLKKGSVYYDPVQFSAADANFTAVECFHQIVDGEINEDKTNTDPEQIANFIRQWSKKQGAIDMGVTRLKDYHKYTHVGRGPEFGDEVSLDHKYAIALTVEMDKFMMDSAPKGPAVLESSEQYLKAGTIATQVAQFIRNLGYPARAHIDGNYRVVCPLVARDAGLGEIGRMGLLMTPRLGPRVRIAVVTTDLPLACNKRKPEHSVIDFCRICKKCSEVCPSQAISLDDMKEIDGVKRWQINSEKCFHLWCVVGTDCGRCMTVCPYSHPDNLLHNFIRFGVRNSSVFRSFALWMDNIFYGSRPAIKPLPEWISSVQHSGSNQSGDR